MSEATSTAACVRCADLTARLELLRLTFEGQAVHLRASTHRINQAAPEAEAWESAAYKLYVAVWGMGATS